MARTQLRVFGVNNHAVERECDRFDSHSSRLKKVRRDPAVALIAVSFAVNISATDPEEKLIFLLIQ